MARGDKSKYTDKQKRQASKIADSYEERGLSEKEAEGRAWATVNKDSGGGKKSGSGRGKHVEHKAAKRGGELGGEASASRPAAERSASAKKAAATRKRGVSGSKTATTKKRVSSKKTSAKKTSGKKASGKKVSGKKTARNKTASKK